MNVHEVIDKRRSIRGYQSKGIAEDKVKQLCAAAQRAPSTHNDQSYKFVLVRDKDTRRALSEAAAGQAFVAEAPLVVAGVCLDPDYHMRSGVAGHIVDIAIALDHITLAAAEEGLGTCWVGAFSQDKVRQILGVPDSSLVTALITVGYPNYVPAGCQRKSLSELICYERFQP